LAADLPAVRSRPPRPPLSRRPKELTSEPTVFEATGDGPGGIILVAKPSKAAGKRAKDGSGATVMTEDPAEVVALDSDFTEVDASVRAAAREIAARLWIRRARSDSANHRGAGLLRSVPYRDGLDDIDLDRTLEVMAERPVLEDEDIIVRERVRDRRAVVLAVDLSGSMRDERIRTAAATVGALAAELPHDDLAVLTFWSDAAWLSHFGVAIEPYRLLDTLVAMPTRGLTNVALPLELAARELAGLPATDARVVLLSDCVHNAGPDPRPLAARLPRLDILLDALGENDLDLGRQMTRLGRGRLRLVRHHRDVAPALSAIFAP
jgi:Mg-chelatase subunit ChlD